MVKGADYKISGIRHAKGPHGPFPMGLWSLTLHLANFAAPALLMGTLLAFFVPLFFGKRPVARDFIAQAAMNFVAGLLVLVAGLVAFGNDGKMATYIALVLAMGTAQFLGVRR